MGGNKNIHVKLALLGGYGADSSVVEGTQLRLLITISLKKFT